MVITGLPVTDLHQYAPIPIAFSVRCVFEVAESGERPDDFVLTERAIAVPYVKDYDALDGGPLRWAERWDMTNWGLFLATNDGRTVGGAAVALRTPGLQMLEGRNDLAVLWDIRVAPEARRQGVGAALMAAAEAWALERGSDWMKVETQNVNIPACRFYHRMGFALSSVNRFAYPELPDEIQLLWTRRLT